MSGWMAGVLFCCELNVVLTANMTQLLMVCTVNCFILFIYLLCLLLLCFSDVNVYLR